MWNSIILLLEISWLTTVVSSGRPLLQEILVPRNLKENQTTTRLICSIIQGEPIEFTWYLNDQKLEQNNKKRIISHDESSELVIKSLSIDDLGEYKCIGRNEHGEDVQRAYLLFNVKPMWTKEPEDVIAQLFDEIALKCDVKSHPNSVVEWSKLDADQQTVIEEYKSKMINFKLIKEKAGFYRCKAINPLGEIEKTIKVKLTGK